jgi:hypothetical protein
MKVFRGNLRTASLRLLLCEVKAKHYLLPRPEVEGFMSVVEQRLNNSWSFIELQICILQC